MSLFLNQSGWLLTVEMVGPFRPFEMGFKQKITRYICSVTKRKKTLMLDRQN